MRSQIPSAGSLIPAALTLLALGSAPVRSQEVPRVQLSRPDAQLAESFSAVAGLRELSNGTVIVTDRTEQRIARVDFAKGTVTDLGRRGEGPGEYEMPGELFTLGGDSTLMVDFGNQRLTVIEPDGRLSTKSRPLRGPQERPLMLRGVDRQGRLYFDLAGMMMPGLEEAAASGVAPLYRWDQTSGKLDSLGTVSFPPMPATRGGGRGDFRISIGGGGPYRGRDEWAVAADGRIAIARYQDYHVEWIAADGRSARGPMVSYKPVPVTQAEKDAWADQMATRGLMVVVENGQRRTMRPPRPDVEKQDWPEFMPAFLNRAATVTPEGELWVLRAGPAKEKAPTFDVFDGHGNLVRQVMLPASRRFVGFGKGVLYAVRVDDDELEWLERYRR